MIEPYSNWQGPVWINTNFLYYLALKRYGFEAEARQLAGTLGRLVLADIQKWNSMHECYNGETGEGLAPTAEQSKDHKLSLPSSAGEVMFRLSCSLRPTGLLFCSIGLERTDVATGIGP